MTKCQTPKHHLDDDLSFALLKTETAMGHEGPFVELHFINLGEPELCYVSACQFLSFNMYACRPAQHLFAVYLVATAVQDRLQVINSVYFGLISNPEK